MEGAAAAAGSRGGSSSSLVFRGCHLPPGFRFQPTDQEIIVCYLKKKIAGTAASVTSIVADVDIYKFDPWDLPDKAMFGEGEWFFFSPRDRKYPNGARPNRTAGSGYWKATGTDKPILAAGGAHCLGVKKALVFYQGRSPKGSKTEWVMHEYRLLDTDAAAAVLARPPAAGAANSMRLDDWVLCRVRKKGVSLGPADMGDDTSSEIEGTTTIATTTTRAATEYHHAEAEMEMAAAAAAAATHREVPVLHHQDQDQDDTAGLFDIIGWNNDDDGRLLMQYLIAGGPAGDSPLSPHHMHTQDDRRPSSTPTGHHRQGHGMVPLPTTGGTHHHHGQLASVLESIKRNLSFQAIDELYLLHQPSSKRANCMTTTTMFSSRSGHDDHVISTSMSSPSPSPTCFSISDTDEVF